MKHPHALYQNSSVLLTAVEVPELPEKLTFAGQELFIKDEFHITLVSARYLAEIINLDKQDVIMDEILEEFDTFVETTPLEKYTLSDELRFVQTDTEKTIVIMADIPNLQTFFSHLSQRYTMELPEQQPHITLYRYPKDFVGISIPSRETLEAISKPVAIPELSKQFERM